MIVDYKIVRHSLILTVGSELDHHEAKKSNRSQISHSDGAGQKILFSTFQKLILWTVQVLA